MHQSTLHIVNVKTNEQLLWCDVPVANVCINNQEKELESSHEKINKDNIVAIDNVNSNASHNICIFANRFPESASLSPELERRYNHAFEFIDVASRHCYEFFGKHMKQREQQQQQQQQQQHNMTNSKNKLSRSTLHTHTHSAPQHVKSVFSTVDSSPCVNSSAWSECDQVESPHVKDREDDNINLINADNDNDDDDDEEAMYDLVASDNFIEYNIVDNVVDDNEDDENVSSSSSSSESESLSETSFTQVHDSVNKKVKTEESIGKDNERRKSIFTF